MESFKDYYWRNNEFENFWYQHKIKTIEYLIANYLNDNIDILSEDEDKLLAISEAFKLINNNNEPRYFKKIFTAIKTRKYDGYHLNLNITYKNNYLFDWFIEPDWFSLPELCDHNEIISVFDLEEQNALKTNQIYEFYAYIFDNYILDLNKNEVSIYIDYAF